MLRPSRKPDSGHTGTISITADMRWASWNARGGAAGRYSVAACERVRFAGGMRIEQFRAEDGRRADACYEIFRATRMAD
ncbi:MAG: hypothetical protein WA634_00475, partial [Silvibacterium sp.]